MNAASRRILVIARSTGLFTPLFLVGFTGGFTLHSSLVSAQAAQVRVTELQCSGDPELVAVTNQGVSAPGVTVFVESGPAASGTFVWSQNFIFRDGDPTDFVRIVDSTGTVVTEVSCQGTSPTATSAPTTAPTSAPTAAPTSAPTRAAATPTPAPADVVPLGGGPPTPSSGTFVVFMLAVGLVAIGVGALTVLTTSPAGARTSVVGLGGRRLGWAASGRPAGQSRLLYLLLLGVLAVAAHAVRSRRRY